MSPQTRTDPSRAPIPENPPACRDELEEYLATFTNYETWASLPTDRRLLGPRRCAALLERAGLLPPSARVLQVAGSKGKGSTVLWMEALLAARSVRCIAALSPHLERLEERIRNDGAPIRPEELLATIGRLHPHIQSLDREDPNLRPTFFDWITAAAVSVAAETRTDWLILEVGLGGPLDSSTAVPHDVGVLTTIDLEHREQLGPTLGAIAAEKARIARADRPFLISACGEQDAEALRAAHSVAEERGARVIMIDDDPRVPAAIEPPQRGNLAAALAALESAGTERFGEDEIARAISRVHLPARLEILPGPPSLLLDSGHTIRSLRYFAERFRTFRAGRPAAILIGMMADKEWREALAPLLEEREVAWLITAVPGPRTEDPEAIARYFRDAGHEAEVWPLDRAIQRLRELAPCALAMTGSFHLAGAVRRAWGPADR